MGLNFGNFGLNLGLNLGFGNLSGLNFDDFGLNGLCCGRLLGLNLSVNLRLNFCFVNLCLNLVGLNLILWLNLTHRPLARERERERVTTAWAALATAVWAALVMVAWAFLCAATALVFLATAV